MEKLVYVDDTLPGIMRKRSGKGGKEHDPKIEDAGLATAVRPVTSADVNACLRETMGADFSAKHFRTFHASSLAFEKLAQGPGEVRLKEMLEHVSERLGNTPATARSSYIHPAVIARIEGQEAWRATLKLPRQTRWLRGGPRQRGAGALQPRASRRCRSNDRGPPFP